MLQDLVGSFAVAAAVVAVAVAIIWLVVKYDVAKMAVTLFISIIAMAAAAGCFA